MLTGRTVSADEAYRRGLVSELVDDDRLLERALELAGQIAAHSPLGVQMTKRALQVNTDAADLSAALELENRNQVITPRHRRGRRRAANGGREDDERAARRDAHRDDGRTRARARSAACCSAASVPMSCASTASTEVDRPAADRHVDASQPAFHRGRHEASARSGARVRADRGRRRVRRRLPARRRRAPRHRARRSARRATRVSCTRA